MCGGTIFADAARIVDKGLSPRVRGNPARISADSDRSGSIPACAGEPTLPIRGTHQTRVYPRVCGGTRASLVHDALYQGLSPRVRGNHNLPTATEGLYRSIPACAGEPPPAESTAPITRVYPRVCGGTFMSGTLTMARAGLSPRVRGNRVRLDLVPFVEGSIPACAGEPALRPAAWPVVRVYPRVCGGTVINFSHQCFSEGLSPRVRGNLELEHWNACIKRSIPACAGEPLAVKILILIEL